MEPAESPLAAVLRFLDASFRVGRFFGTEVRVYGAWLIVLLLVVVPLETWSFLPLGTRLLFVLLGVLSLYLSVWVHEMGHVTAGRLYRIDTPLITLSPLGGLAHLQRPAPNPKADIVIALAGPAAQALLVALVWPLARLVGASPFGLLHGEVAPYTLARLVEMNLLMLGFNLLPLYPMDGGRVFRSLLALRMHPNRATLIAARVGMVGAVAGGIAGLVFWGGAPGGTVVAIAVTNFLACQRAVLEARYSDGPYAEMREPWEEDPEAWKRGQDDADEEVAPSPRQRVRRAPEPPAKAAPSQQELDRLLDRVREVGLAGLSESERAALLKASEARRAGH